MGDLIILGDHNNVNNAGGGINQNGTTIEKGIGVDYLINVSESLKKFGLSEAYHWLFIIKLNGINITGPKLLEKYQSFNNNSFTGIALNSINVVRTKAKDGEVKFEQLFNEPKLSTLHIETALRLSKNSIQFEYAQYKLNDDLRTNFCGELLPSLLLLYFCKILYGDKKTDIEILIETTVKGKLAFEAMGINYFNFKRSIFSTYLMSEKHTINETITDFENDTIIEILDKVVEGFSASSQLSEIPFLSIDAPRQQSSLEVIKSTIFK